MAGGTRWQPAMRLALDAARAAGEAGDVPIGAVLLAGDDRVLAVAGNERERTGDPTAHAEVLVLRRGSELLRARPGDQTGTTRAPSPVADGPEPGSAGGGDALVVDASWRLEDCTLVVTLEPCTMCAGALVNARVGRLVFGAFDPKAGAVSSIRDVVRDPLLNHRVDVVSGVLADECGHLLRDFFSHRR